MANPTGLVSMRRSTGGPLRRMFCGAAGRTFRVAWLGGGRQGGQAAKTSRSYCEV
jgi:hypothetical protein